MIIEGMEMTNDETSIYYDPKKQNLPRRSDYVGSLGRLKVWQTRYRGLSFFALDEALMCHRNYEGRSDEFIIWVYGPDSRFHFNGFSVLGNKIVPINVQEREASIYRI